MPLPPPRTLLELIAAQPRPAGGAAEAGARARCGEWLREQGFAVEERGFEYSALPGRWGTPFAGVASVAALAVVALLASGGQPRLALTLAVVGATLAAVAGRWLARHGVLDLPALRRRGVNLLARRGEPAVWLVAHLDTKSQPVPIGVRAAGIVGTLIIWCITGALLLSEALGWAPSGRSGLWTAVFTAGLATALPVVLTTVGSASAGAVDDASGVATVLHAVSLVPRALPMGVALTSAEELGLAGARAWARGTSPATALNVDGVDDDGETVAMYTGTRPGRICRALVSVAAHAGDPPVRCRRLVPGILTDGVALADAGWEVVTVSRGTRRTLQRIHSRRDDLVHLEGSGIAPVAALLARAAVHLGDVGSPQQTTAAEQS